MSSAVEAVVATIASVKAITVIVKATVVIISLGKVVVSAEAAVLVHRKPATVVGITLKGAEVMHPYVAHVSVTDVAEAGRQALGSAPAATILEDVDLAAGIEVDALIRHVDIVVVSSIPWLLHHGCTEGYVDVYAGIAAKA